MQTLSLQGEVIEIFERDGRRHARVRLESATFVDVSIESLGDLHLGDRVLVGGALDVEGVREEPHVPDDPRRV